MHYSSALEALASSLHHAANIAFPEISYETRDWETMSGWTQAQKTEAARNSTWPMVTKVRRPLPKECVVLAMFLQSWGSTALGFGGIGGAAITSAYTVVVESPTSIKGVYWAGRLAYLLDPSSQTKEQKEAFAADLAANKTVARAQAALRYGATIPERS